MQNAGIFSHLFKKNILNPYVLLNLDLSNINTSYLYIISLLDTNNKGYADDFVIFLHQHPVTRDVELFSFKTTH